jgi:hypothetical protein
MILLSIIEMSKESVKEFERTIKNLQKEKKDLWEEFKNDYAQSYDIKNDDNNDQRALDLLYEHAQIDQEIFLLEIAIQKLQNLLATLEEIKQGK